MPNRVLREGILDSERMAALVHEATWAGECFYRRLHSIADDFGCFDARPSVLRAKCYPTLLDMVREADVQRWIAACVKSGLVALYTCDGRNYGQILNFKQFTRQRKRHHPPPPWELNCNSTAIAVLGVDSVSDSDSDSGKGGAGEKPDLLGFLRFWAEYPGDRKADKQKCREKWERDELEALAETVLAGLAWWKNHRDWKKKDGEFICAPLVWLNQKRWEAATACKPNVVARPLTVAEKWAKLSAVERADLVEGVRIDFKGNDKAQKMIDEMMAGGRAVDIIVEAFFKLRSEMTRNAIGFPAGGA